MAEIIFLRLSYIKHAEKGDLRTYANLKDNGNRLVEKAFMTCAIALCPSSKTW